MIIKATHGKHELVHDEGKHDYHLDGKPLSGVTTIIGGGYPKSPYLINWQVKQGAAWILEAIGDMSPKDLTSEHQAELIKEAPNAYKIALDEAADIGTLVHEYCYQSEASDGSTQEVASQIEAHKDKTVIETAIKQFHEWRESLEEDDIIGLEKLVCSIKHKYAGRFDRLSCRTGVVTLSDYKTSSGFYVTQFIQLAAYAIAIKEWLDIDVEDMEIIRFDKKTGKLTTRNLSQLAGTWGVKSTTAMKRLKDLFISILTVSNFKYRFDRYIRK